MSERSLVYKHLCKVCDRVPREFCDRTEQCAQAARAFVAEENSGYHDVDEFYPPDKPDEEKCGTCGGHGQLDEGLYEYCLTVKCPDCIGEKP